METLKKCLNPKVLLGLSLIAIGVLLFAPHWFATALPVLILAACPLSMVIMMAMMNGHGDKKEESILNKRYAKGEIDEETFNQMKSNLAKEK